MIRKCKSIQQQRKLSDNDTNHSKMALISSQFIARFSWNWHQSIAEMLTNRSVCNLSPPNDKQRRNWIFLSTGTVATFTDSAEGQEKMNETSPFTHCAMQMNTSSSLELMLSTRFSVTVTRVLSKTCAASLLFSWRMLISFWMPRCSARGRIESRTWTMSLTATQIFKKCKKYLKIKKYIYF